MSFKLKSFLVSTEENKHISGEMSTNCWKRRGLYSDEKKFHRKEGRGGGGKEGGAKW